MALQIETNQLPRLRLLPPWHALRVLASNLAGRHCPVGTAADEAQIAGLRRRHLQYPRKTAETLSYLESGTMQGRRILFVHGTPGDAKGWADYLLNVPSGRCHIAPDRPGYGRSSRPAEVFGLARQAKALLPLLTSPHGKKPIVVGHSSGAAVAVRTALDHPHALGGLLLLAGALDPALEEAHWVQLLAARKPIARLLPRRLDVANRELLGLKRDLSAMAGRLHGIRMPVGVVHGDLDPLVSPANTDYLIRKLTNARVDHRVLKRADHFIPWHSKPAIDRALERLIEQVRKTEQER